MAVVAPTITPMATGVEDVIQYTWVLDGKTVIATDQFTAAENPGKADRSVHVHGPTFNSATIVIEGSNKVSPTTTSAADWITLTDSQGNDLSFTSQALKEVLPLTRWIRPRVSAGTPTTVTVDLLIKGYL